MKNTSVWLLLIRIGAAMAVLGMIAALAFGYLGRVHMAFDAFSHFRIHIAVLLVACVPALLLIGFRTSALVPLLVGAAAIVQTTGLPVQARLQAAGAAATDGAVYRLMHANLRFDNPTPHALLSLIGRLKPDVVTLAEVSPHWTEALALTEEAYPYRILCKPSVFVGGVAILSRRPFAAGFEPLCADRGAFARVRVDFGGREAEIVALHMGWPWPYAQPWQLPRLIPLLGEVGDTAIIAGDLNAAPWSEAARRLAAGADAQILRGIGPTWLHRRLPGWLLPWIGLPIDNGMIKGAVVRRGLATADGIGSDHVPFVLDFMLLPQEQPPRVQHAMRLD